MIAAPLTIMLRTANSLKNLLTSVDETKKDEVVDKDTAEGVSG